MKKRLSTSELGSMMIEALAMLALIALVTPVLYRKTAERTTELQDINTAGELRAIIKAVDDYVAANYDAIADGNKVTNSCEAGSHKTQDYAAFKNKTEASIEVPIGHFCEFLPYGILDASGKAKKSRLFSENYKIVLKLKGSADATAEKGDKVITSFVITEPNTELPEIRSSSIASMIGGNGGYVTSTSGSGTSATGTISGNLGIWSIADAKKELGVSVTKNAVVAASIQGISAQSAKIDISGVLYRINTGDIGLNTMSTDLYLGAKGSSTRHNITNIGKLIVGSEDAHNSSLYINSGDIKIGGAGNISVGGAGSLTLANGNITTNAGSIQTLNGNIQTSRGDFIASSGNISVSGTMKAANNVFQVAADGVTTAKRYIAGSASGEATISDTAGSVKINQPLVVTKTGGNCTISDQSGCALKVVGNAYVGGNLTITETFDAKNLHAREKLTVGGNAAGTGKTLSVVYTDDNKGSFDFGGLLKVNKTAANTGTMTFATDLMKVDTTTKGFGVNGNIVQMIAGNSELGMQNNNAYLKTNNDNSFSLDASNAYIRGKTSIQLNGESFKVNGTKDNITSNVASFNITPTGGGYFRVGNASTGLSGNMVLMNNIPTYMNGSSSDLYMRDSSIHVQNGATDSLLIRKSTTNNAFADMKAQKIIAKNQADTSILEIDLTNTSTTNSSGSPVYIRQGAIELTKTNATQDLTYNYVKADRFVANTTTANNIKTDANGNATAKYEVNPAYTSVMHDIKLTTRGGARLSDILPDFINKGIYVVDNTYPARGYSGCGGGKPLSGSGSYFTLSRANKINATNCTSLSNEVSPWAGFVPTPTCPPGYAKVITLTPASFAMAQAGYPQATVGQHRDLHQNYSYAGPLNNPGASPVPLYAQKNTWLKSFVQTSYKNGSGSSSSGTAANFEGWDVGMGFIYPYSQYKTYADQTGGSGGSSYDSSGSEASGTKIIWNMFPVYAGTLEGYATVYCYFNRAGGGFNSSLVDTQYDQLSTDGNVFRASNSKGNAPNKDRLNSSESGLGVW